MATGDALRAQGDCTEITSRMWVVSTVQKEREEKRMCFDEVECLGSLSRWCVPDMLVTFLRILGTN
jgi:hypothetical protein